MSNVSTILTQLASEVGALLSDYSELDYVYDVEKNTFRTGQRRYGIGVEGGLSVDGTIKSITIDQTFFIKLTDCTANRSSDSSERVAISSLYDDFETIQKNIFQKKLGIPSVVLVVSELDMESPEKVGDNTIMLKGNFIIKHRNQTT
jgi:hypothetical protein